MASDVDTDFEALMNAVLPFAKQMLEEHGGFSPFGAAITDEGDLNMVAPPESGEEQTPQGAIEQLEDAFRRGAESGTYRASALAFSAQAVEPDSENATDAIAICIDHANHHSAVVLFRYELTGEALLFAEPVAQEGEHAIFGPPQGH